MCAEERRSGKSIWILAFAWENTYEETLSSIANIKNNYRLADQYGVTVSNQEVITYTAGQRNLYDNKVPEDLKNGIKKIIQAIGLTEDEYWTKYKLKENQDYLTYLHVAEYQDANDIAREELLASDVEILKEEFLKKNVTSTLHNHSIEGKIE